MLDTLRYSKRLQSAGFSQEQAEAQAEALRDEISESVVTREQLASTEQRLDAKIEGVEQRLSAEIRQLSTEIKSLRWMMGLLLGLVLGVLGLTAAVLVKLLVL